MADQAVKPIVAVAVLATVSFIIGGVIAAAWAVTPPPGEESEPVAASATPAECGTLLTIRCMSVPDGPPFCVPAVVIMCRPGGQPGS